MKLWRFEKYKVGMIGDYHITSMHRADEREKRKMIAEIKRKGYSYDRSTKEYVYYPSPEETTSLSKYVWVVKSYNI